MVCKAVCVIHKCFCESKVIYLKSRLAKWWKPWFPDLARFNNLYSEEPCNNSLSHPASQVEKWILKRHITSVEEISVIILTNLLLFSYTFNLLFLRFLQKIANFLMFESKFMSCVYEIVYYSNLLHHRNLWKYAFELFSYSCWSS